MTETLANVGIHLMSTDVSTAGPDWNHQLQYAGCPGCPSLSGWFWHAASLGNWRCELPSPLFSASWIDLFATLLVHQLICSYLFSRHPKPGAKTRWTSPNMRSILKSMPSQRALPPWLTSLQVKNTAAGHQDQCDTCRAPVQHQCDTVKIPVQH